MYAALRARGRQASSDSASSSYRAAPTQAHHNRTLSVWDYFSRRLPRFLQLTVISHARSRTECISCTLNVWTTARVRKHLNPQLPHSIPVRPGGF
jgi:hypothetical protein